MASWLARGAVLLLASALPPGAAAFESSFVPRVSSRVEVNDNPGLAIAAARSVTTLSLRPSLEHRLRSEAWELTTTGDVADNRATDPKLNRTDFSLSAQGLRRFERGSATLAGLLRRDTTLGSASAPGAALPGVALPRVQRTSFSLGPSGTWLLGERASAFAEAGIQGTRYPADAPRGMFDFRTRSASGGLAWQWSEQTSLRLSAAHTDFETLATANRSFTDTLQVVLSHERGERTSVVIGGGPTRLRSDSAANVPVCPVDTLFCSLGLVPFTVVTVPTSLVVNRPTWNASVQHALDERTSLSARAGLSFGASGAGALSRTQNLSLGVSRKLGDTLTLALDAVRVESLLQGPAAAATPTLTRQVGVSLAWRLSDDLSVDCGYRRLEVQGPAGTPVSNVLYGSLSYSLPRRFQ